MNKRNFIEEEKEIQQAKIDVVEGTVAGIVISMIMLVVLLGLLS